MLTGSRLWLVGLLAPALVLLSGAPGAAATRGVTRAHYGMMGGGMYGTMGRNGMMGGGMYGMTGYCQQALAADSADLDRVTALLESARTSTDLATSQRDIAKAQALLADMRQRTSTCSSMLGQMRRMMTGNGSTRPSPATPGAARP